MSEGRDVRHAGASREEGFGRKFDSQGVLRVPASGQLRTALQALGTARAGNMARAPDITSARLDFDARLRAALRDRIPPSVTDQVKFSECSVAGVRVVLVHPDDPLKGGLIHVHGGGWCLGSPDSLRPALARMAIATSTVVASIDYRLAPEHPHPAPLDDCVAAIAGLVEHWHAAHGFAPGRRVVLTGESAGAHLGLLAMLRVRERGLRFAGACLTYGLFDLSNTLPSRGRNAGSALLDARACRSFVHAYLGADRPVDASVSPALLAPAALRDLGPALFCVGTADPLFDDSVALHERWRDAKNPAWRVEYEEAPHAFDLLPVPEASHLIRMQARFVRHCLDCA